MNERLKLIRKTLSLNQAEFGGRLGVTPTAISRIEKGERSLTDQMFLAICREFNVNESWLRTGNGDMFVHPDTFSLDELAKKNNLTPFELDIVKALMTIDEQTRHSLVAHFKKHFCLPY
ncbi:MAG: helix-turn-helix domain-containing protein [Sporomusa sp.]